MCWRTFSAVFLVGIFVFWGNSAWGDTTDYTKPEFRIQPSSYVAQFAGGIGLFSLGAGWDYGKNERWVTDVLLGYVPKYDTDRGKFTVTIRQTLTPWSIRLKGRFAYQPLRTGMYLSSTLSKQFWFSTPEKYPSKYYQFSTRLRAYAFVGQSFSFRLPSNPTPFKRIGFYYDLHASDMMLVSRIQNRRLTGFDYLGLSLGLKFRI